MTESDVKEPVGPKSGGDPDTTAFVERINAAGQQGTAKLADLLQQGKTVDDVLDGLAGPVSEHACHWLEAADNGPKFLAVLGLVAAVGQNYVLRLHEPGNAIRVTVEPTRTKIQVIT